MRNGNLIVGAKTWRFGSEDYRSPNLGLTQTITIVIEPERCLVLTNWGTESSQEIVTVFSKPKDFHHKAL